MIEFKKLEIKSEETWLKRTIGSKHFRKSVIYVIIGAIAGFAYFYFTEGKHMDNIPLGEIAKSMIFGGVFGYFITNNPCAKGKC